MSAVWKGALFVLRYVTEVLHTIGKQTRWIANGV